MSRIAAWLVPAAVLLAGTGVISANDGPCTFGLKGSHALRMFPFIHQHGPLYNYGPYYGYPPFEPYGYWNAYLQYTGPTDPVGAGQHGGRYGWINGGYPHTFGHGNPHALSIGGWGWSGGWGSRGVWGHGGHGHGCKTCGGAAADYVAASDPAARYNGYGDPTASAAFYAVTPSLLTPPGITAVNYLGR